MDTSPLRLGPLLRYVDQTSASIWVESVDAAAVTVRAGDRSWSSRTFGVHGHHYAVVDLDGLAPGSRTAYTVEIDDVAVWPPEGSPYPPSVVPTLDPGRRLRLLYGSCRTSVGHDAAGNKSHGVDALRAFAQRLATDPTEPWPDLVLFLGDQVYADETTEEMQEFIRSRRDVTEPPGEELKDYAEYAHLYYLAWSDPLNRWLLSTLPSSMIFDDHDVRDDWNTSHTWREQMAATSWWQERIVAGFASYWVYQQLGNLGPAERAEDRLWRRIRDHAGAAELDVSDAVDELADRANQHPDSYRWSYVRDIADVRLIVVDTRAARVLEPDRRSMLDESEMGWLDEQMQGGFRHVLIGTSLPFLLPPGLHHLEAWDEAVAAGAWGRRLQRFGETLRQGADLEHWAAFQEGFTQVAAMASDVADGRRGPAPETVTFLSGDVHHSYLSEVRRPRVRGRGRILQAVCSPIRNPLAYTMRFATATLSYGLAGPLGAALARSSHVRPDPFKWDRIRGPWFQNSIATLQDTPRGLALSWEAGVVHDGDNDHPVLKSMADILIRPH